MDKTQLLQMTADIVAAHASTTPATQEEILSEIDKVFGKLAALVGVGEELPTVETESAETPGVPAVPLAAAFGHDKVFCMVCGKGMKTLKRHLGTSHNMKPGEYRKTFGIPAGTSLVAKAYSESRKEIAKGADLVSRLEKARAARKSSKKAAPTKSAKPAKKAAPKKAKAAK